MSESPSSAGKVELVPRAWSLWLLMVVLLVSGGLAAWLAWSHIHLTHGVGAFDSHCSVDATFDCDKVNTSEWSELRGLPISLYALPVYAAMAYFAWVGRRGDRRGHRARGLLTLLASVNVAVSVALLFVMVVNIGAFCLFCLSLDALHVAALALVLAPPGGRKPAIPEGLDLFGAAFVSVFLMATTFQFTVIYSARLDRVAVASVLDAEPGPAQVDVKTESRAGAVVKLPGERHDVPTDKYDAAWGPRSAKVTVVEFADFECGYCRRLSHTMAVLKERYKGRVRFVFKHYPMDLTCNKRLNRQHHPSACQASLAAICAQDQGKFEPYHDILFQHQDRLATDDLIRYAERLGMDTVRFAGCMKGSGSMEQLLEDISHGGYLDISGTPRTFVNGLMFKGAVSEAILDAAIRAELGEADVKEDGRVVTDNQVVVDAPLSPGEVPMVSVSLGETTFWIDAVESSIDAEGRARAMARVPPRSASWSEAQAACAAAGKRLCSSQEWMTACQGTVAKDDDGDGSFTNDDLEGRSYPYGSYYREGYCHDSGDKDRQGAVPTGSRAACRTPEGIYDLTGNVQEWVGQTPGTAVLLGGAWYFEDKARCATTSDTYGADWSSRTSGFRCCADSAVAAPALESSLAVRDENAVGQVATFAPAATLDGKTFVPEQLDGHVTLLAFWASWCGPCRKELPALAPLATELGPAGFQVVAVNVDKDPAAALRFLGGQTPPYTVVTDPSSALMGRFDVVAMPTSILIGPDRKVLGVHEGYSEEKLAELRKEISALLDAK